MFSEAQRTRKWTSFAKKGRTENNFVDLLYTHSFSSDSGCVNGDCIPATGDKGYSSFMTFFIETGFMPLLPR